MTYDEALGYINSLLVDRRPALEVEERLARIRRLLSALRLGELPYPIVLVAGTKGKGSTATMLATILGAAGRRVGLYTKPHVSDYRERIKVGGEPIPRETLAGLVERVAPAVEAAASGHGGRPTYFEVSLALALQSFVDAAVDISVVEVGIGGRLDAANALDPVLSVITPISLDHTELLGERLEAIARHKAGVMRAGRPVVVAPQTPEVDAALTEESTVIGARLIRVGDIARWTHGAPGEYGETFELRTEQTAYGSLDLSLRGRHQVANAVTAVVTAELTQHELSPPAPLSRDAVATGLRATVLPGRVECLPGVPPIVLDVAHNPASMEALRNALDEYFPGRPVVLLFAMVSTHDPVETAALIAGRARLVIVTEPPHTRAMPAAALADVVRRYAGAVEVVPDRLAAVDRVLAAATTRDVVCVTGSVYLIGDVRDRLVATRSTGEGSARRVG